MITKEQIERYGGKGAILNYLRQNCPDLPIPSYSYDIADFTHMRKPVIVRSSSPHEYGDFEGIFDSVRDVNTQNELEGAINSVKASATSERAREYARQRNIPIDGEIKFFIQEQSLSRYCGAMMRHPNNPNLIFINYFSGWGDNMRDHFYYGYDEKRQGMARLNNFTSQKRAEENSKFLVEQYKRI